MGNGFIAHIDRVIDGDSLVVIADLMPLLGINGSVRHDIRLAGIDAPETTTPAGLVARAWLTALAEGKDCLVALHKREKFGRALCDVWLAGDTQSLSEHLIAAGQAKPYSGGKRS